METEIELDPSDAKILASLFDALDLARRDLSVAATVIFSRMGHEPGHVIVNGVRDGKAIVVIPDDRQEGEGSGVAGHIDVEQKPRVVREDLAQ